MILKDIRLYLQQRGQATLGDIARHFDSDPSAVQGMLEQWVRKGKVRRSLATSSCGSSCSKCDPTSVEIYQWADGSEDTSGRTAVPLPSCDR
jgi:predicted transcriptional regulator with HTH domain